MLAESWMHFEIDRQNDPAVLKQLEADLQRVLEDVRNAVEDFAKMRALALQTARGRCRSTRRRSTPRRSRTAWSCCAGWPTGTSPSSATASTAWRTSEEGDTAARRARHRPAASCAARQGRAPTASPRCPPELRAKARENSSC